MGRELESSLESPFHIHRSMGRNLAICCVPRIFHVWFRLVTGFAPSVMPSNRVRGFPNDGFLQKPQNLLGVTEQIDN